MEEHSQEAVREAEEEVLLQQEEGLLTDGRTQVQGRAGRGVAEILTVVIVFLLLTLTKILPPTISNSITAQRRGAGSTPCMGAKQNTMMRTTCRETSKVRQSAARGGS